LVERHLGLRQVSGRGQVGEPVIDPGVALGGPEGSMVRNGTPGGKSRQQGQARNEEVSFHVVTRP
jgi:hypothetical protein